MTTSTFENLDDRIRRIVREEIRRLDDNFLWPEDYSRLAAELEAGLLDPERFGIDTLARIKSAAPDSDRRGPGAH